MNVSVLIPVYNKSFVIGKILSALETQMDSKDEVLVMNDRSTDDSGKIIEEFTKKQCFYKMLTRSGGKGYRVASCRNCLVREAQNEYLIFLSGDCIPRDNFIRMYKDALPIIESRTIVRGLINIGPAYIGKYHSEWDKTITGNISLTKWDFNLIGGFDENFDGCWGHEDMEFSYRAIKIYKYRVYDIEVYVDHIDHPREEQVGARNLRYFKRKHFL